MVTRRGLLGGVLGLWTVDALCGPQNMAMAENVPGPRPTSDVHGDRSGGGGGSRQPRAPRAAPREPIPDGSPPEADVMPGHGGGMPYPDVSTRLEWKARPPIHPATVLDRKPDRIIVHHTSTPNSPDMSLDHAFRLSRDIQRFHMQGRGWADSGQQLTISRGGIVMEGRNRSLAAIRAGKHVVGAQVLGHNSHTIGIENEGTYMTEDVPDALWGSLVEVCAWLCVRYRLKPAKAIIGHRDLNNTDCPGDRLYERLPDLRTAVALRLDPQAVLPSPIPDASDGPEAFTSDDVNGTVPPFRLK
ncbi:peptidoglycan recognition protein family protein [Actinomadura oligospora]|uniref:peptidoglycan recognition protein family protein n=1 Tax=Actinomadura oligospora TaxID=111804 RepID=UPI001FE17C4B|nr:peptidoglycan recognition family protein [Actinomadura oligospora]